MQYRIDFYISSIGMIVGNLLGILSLSILFKSIPNILGWTYYELLFIYGFSLIVLSPLQLFFDNLWNLPTYLITGDFIKYYLKPINIFFYYFAEIFDIKGISQLLIGIFTLFYSWKKLQIELSIINIGILIISIISGSLVMISLMVIASSVAFWVLNVTPLLNFIFRLREYTKYPMDIFDPFLRFIFSFVIPIAFVAYYPSKIFLRHSNNNNLLVLILPFIGISLFLIAYKIWTKGAKRYTGTGV
jgi:ABC-2 type transport system permease protein